MAQVSVFAQVNIDIVLYIFFAMVHIYNWMFFVFGQVFALHLKLNFVVISQVCASVTKTGMTD